MKWSCEHKIVTVLSDKQERDKKKPHWTKTTAKLKCNKCGKIWTESDWTTYVYPQWRWGHLQVVRKGEICERRQVIEYREKRD